MRTLTVALPGREYDIIIRSGVLDDAGMECKKVLPGAKRLAVVTDSNVGPLYGERVVTSLEKAGFKVKLITIPAGESSKNMQMLSDLLEEFMAFGITRTDAVVALGGGVVGDLTGFAAASCLRGVDFVQIPTTLLAQVDSSVGGKVAVDLKAGKNLAGAFWQPKVVLMDPDTLNTLSDSIFSDGMAEVIKYGCIWDKDFFELLKAAGDRKGIMADIENVLYTCCDIKRQTVVEDERDTGIRMLLNFGHTLGHAYELAGHYELWTHGQAVAAGICRACDLGVSLGITPPEVPQEVAKVIAQFNLPTQIQCTQQDYRSAVGLDKKSQGRHINLIVLANIGHAIKYKMEREKVLNMTADFAE